MENSTGKGRRPAVAGITSILLAVTMLAAGVLSAQERGDGLWLEESELHSEEERIDRLLNRINEELIRDPSRDIGPRIREVLRRSTVAGYDPGYLGGLLTMGEHYLRRSMPDSAMVPVREGLNFETPPAYRIAFLDQAARAERLRGEHLAAISHLQLALEVAGQTDLRYERPRIYYDLARLHRLIGDNGSAFEFLYRAYLLTEESGQRIAVSVLVEIADLYRQLDSAQEGLWYLDRAIRIAEERAESDLLAQTLLATAAAYLAEGRLGLSERAISHAQAMESDDPFLAVEADRLRGALFKASGEITRARYYFSEALERSRRISHEEGIYHSSIGLGELELSENRIRNAIAWFGSALESARTLHAMPLIERALEFSYRGYRDMGDESEALRLLEALRDHADRVRTLEHERARAEYEARFEFTRQEQENRLLRLRQAEQDARIQLQRTVGVGGIILLVILAGVSAMLFGNVRTRERLNRELQEKNRDISDKNQELDRLNGLKDQLFAVIAHDLRGPLNSLQGLLPLIQEGRLSGDKLIELTNRLDRNLQDNAAIMENLLVWARSQMSGIELEYSYFDPRVIAEDVIGRASSRADEKGIQVTLESRPEELRAYGDVNVYRLVLRNLLSNAIKFSSRGEAVVIRLFRDGKRLLTEVEDNGIGMDPDVKEKIIGEEFFTRKGTESEKGSGLGLRLCREYLARHGGTIRFESEAGRGTTFTFALSIIEDSAV